MSADTSFAALLSGAPLPIERVTAPLSDFGLYHAQTEPFFACEPASPEELAALVRFARERALPLRTRGGGHALNGSSVPGTRELLVRTRALDHYRFERAGTLTVGGGASMWDVRDLAAGHGFYVPVVNNGSSGPTVGGLVAAGGLGPDSERFGGLWSNVAALTLVTGAGEVRRVPREDALFPWLFGAAGQLGVVAEVELEILRSDEVPPTPARPDDGTSHPPAPPPPPRAPHEIVYPLGAHGRVPRVNEIASPEWRRTGAVGHDKLSYWVTVLCPPRREGEAREDLAGLEHHFRSELEYLPLFRYHMVHRGLVAPLVYPHAEDFVALFHWGKLDVATEAGRRVVVELERAFVALIERKGYRRYHQTEFVGDTMDFERYHGPETWAHLHALRRELDPDGVLCPGGLGLSTRQLPGDAWR
jgi:FAD/FMN-containing dehydrogenase